jgi:DNA-binding transcriptional LysR family regulator
MGTIFMVYEALLHNSARVSAYPVGPELLPAVAAFARVAQLASFSKAAAALGISPSALSQTVRALEARLGIRLLNRTTRRVGVTEAGALFLQRVLPALEQFAAAFSELDELRGKPTGTLRISLPRMAMTTVVVPLLRDFCAAYPQIRLDLIADDRFVDLIGEGFDAGIRLGERLAQDMIAVRATREQRSAVVGSPEYFERNPRPIKPADLHQHRCMRFRFSSGVIYRWEFGRAGQEFDIDVDGPLICNDNALMHAAAKQGVGLAHLMEDLVREDLTSGALVRVLEDWCPFFPGFYLYYPSRAQMPLKLRVLVDFVAARLAEP